MQHGQKKKKGKEKQNQGHISATSVLTSPQLHLLSFTPETFIPQGLYNWAAVSGISLQQCWLLCVWAVVEGKGAEVLH